MRRRIVYVVALAAGVAGMTSVADAEDTVALIKRQSQAFSDASATGNAAVLRRLLDDAVVFVDESGNVGSKKDIVDGAGPPPPGVTNRLVQTDLVVRIHGNVAVTSFTDNATVGFHGQTVHDAFRSTEVWLDEPGGWKMISSQTLALSIDPPAVVLPNAVLDDYVGSYEAGPGYRVKIARSDDRLTASVNGGKPIVLRAELRDVFFVPGQPRVRRIFERDASGTIARYVSRREGHDIIFKRVT